MDLVIAAGLLVLLAGAMACVALLLLLCQGRPILHLSERMATPERGFCLVKFRTMRPVAGGLAAQGVTGADKRDRITPLGRLLRRSRIDEWPQLWNVLCGDMSLVGPRPPLRQHVEAAPALFARVLQDRPGITGLASLSFHRHEARLLGLCRDPAETETTYLRRCLPRKARLDLLYQRRRTAWSDLWLMWRSLAVVLGR